MTRETTSGVDDDTEQSDEKNVCLHTAEDKAREALNHNQPGEDCDVFVRTHVRDHDSDRNITDHLIRLGTDKWIAFRTWRTAGDGSGLSVKDHGESLRVEAPSLDHDRITNRIQDEALDMIEAYSEENRGVNPFVEIIRNADAVAGDLVNEWQSASEHLVREHVKEGIAGFTGSLAWTNSDTGIIFEADRVSMRFMNEQISTELSDRKEADLHEILKEGLYAGIDEYRGRRTTHLEYVAEVTLTD